jgi:predicted O-linked N-acetylglucosamine transferase (SPINDLY family)
VSRSSSSRALISPRRCRHLLYALGLPELITPSLEDYRALALRLARNPGDIHALKEKIAKNRRAQPLFDTPRFTKNIERAYQGMWEVYLADERPRPIQVSDRPISEKL